MCCCLKGLCSRAGCHPVQMMVLFSFALSLFLQVSMSVKSTFAKWPLALQARDAAINKRSPGSLRQSFVGSATATAHGLLIVADIGFEAYQTPESFWPSPGKGIQAFYSFQNVAPLTSVLKQQELQPPLEEEHSQ